ncbi:MAG: hypothetical protein K0R18_1659, partial [Bacillales bacterium]|nr:hypothetical protein [Bacillales bacterium]
YVIRPEDLREFEEARRTKVKG